MKRHPVKRMLMLCLVVVMAICCAITVSGASSQNASTQNAIAEIGGIRNSSSITDNNFDFINQESTGVDYLVNEWGQTYGSGPYHHGEDTEPDLLLAEGDGGVVGYVKSVDLNSAYSSPEEAIGYQNMIENTGYHSIPLYESDGVTIIGEFKMFQLSNDE